MSKVFIDSNRNQVLDNNDLVQFWDNGRQVSQRTVEQYLREGSEAQRVNPRTELSRIVQYSGWRVSTPLQARVNQLGQAYEQRERIDRIAGVGGYGGLGASNRGWDVTCTENTPSRAQAVHYFDLNRNAVADRNDRVEVGVNPRHGESVPAFGRIAPPESYGQFEEYYQNISLDYYLTQTTGVYACGDRQDYFRSQVEGNGTTISPMGGTPFRSISPALNSRMRGEPVATDAPSNQASAPAVARTANPASPRPASPAQAVTNRTPDAGVTSQPRDAGVSSNPRVIIVQQPYPVYITRDTTTPVPPNTPSDANTGAEAPTSNRGREVIEGRGDAGRKN